MPWRNEDEDLICGCQTFEEKYEQLKDVILKNRSHYKFHSNVLEKPVEDLDNFTECNEYGNIAPNTQHIDEQDAIVSIKQVLCLVLT